MYVQVVLCCSSSAVQVLPCGLTAAVAGFSHWPCSLWRLGAESELACCCTAQTMCAMLQALGESPVSDLASGREEVPSAELHLLADDASRGLQTEGRAEANDPEYMRNPKRARLA